MNSGHMKDIATRFVQNFNDFQAKLEPELTSWRFFSKIHIAVRYYPRRRSSFSLSNGF